MIRYEYMFFFYQNVEKKSSIYMSHLISDFKLVFEMETILDPSGWSKEANSARTNSFEVWNASPQCRLFGGHNGDHGQHDQSVIDNSVRNRYIGWKHFEVLIHGE